MCTTHVPCVVKHYNGTSRFNIVRVDIQEVTTGVLKTEAVAIFVIDGVDKRHNGNLILWVGRTDVTAS
jgi:hypothetical protein